MTRVKVLIVDDSVVVRRLVSDALEADPAIEIAGTAPNGRIALAKVPRLNPDVIILDVEMPELDGLATLPFLRAQHPRIPVIMFSTLTERGASATMEALRLGAADYVTKPANVGSVTATQERIRGELAPKIKALAGCAPAYTPVTADLVARPRPALPGARKRIDVVCIAVSTGGPNALAAVIPALPRSLPVPVLIVQHMPPLFTSLLAQRLTAGGGIPVEEGAAGTRVSAGRGYIAPGDHHLVVESRNDRVLLALNQEPPENSCRPSADVLFSSVARVYGARALGVVLTGMGHDGLRGARELAAAGAPVIVQDEQTSVVWGMPGAVVRAGLHDQILPLQQIAGELLRRARFGRETASARAGGA